MAANVNRPILLAALLFLLNATRFGEAQPSPPVGGYGFSGVSFNSTAVSIIIAIVAFFFFVLFSVCVRRSTTGRFSSPRTARVGAVSWPSNRASIGLDPTVLDAFPIFVYSRVKALKIGTGALECAVCLSEFKDDDTLRLLPSCSHAFHADCIDMWLASHVTCPVCRSDLTAAGSVAVDGHRFGGEEEVSVGQVAISVEDDGTGPMMGKGEGTLPRSHTTGHDERYTLRLPEHVRVEIGGLRRSASCVALPVKK